MYGAAEVCVLSQSPQLCAPSVIVASRLFSARRRILKQTVQAVEREGALQESHNLYMTLKQFMLKLPDHTVVEQLTATKVGNQNGNE